MKIRLVIRTAKELVRLMLEVKKDQTIEINTETWEVKAFGKGGKAMKCPLLLSGLFIRGGAIKE